MGKRDVRRRATATGTVEKSGYVRVIDEKKVRANDSIELFFPEGIVCTC